MLGIGYKVDKISSRSKKLSSGFMKEVDHLIISKSFEGYD